MIEWLLTSIDPARPHDLAVATAWHARLMVLAWMVLFPAGILIARFLKVTPRQTWPAMLDNKTWWYSHLTTQYAGGASALVALALVVSAGGLMLSSAHARLGWLAVLLMLAQFLGGWMRGSKGGPTAPESDGSIAGDHYDMTPRRRTFERIHKSLGYVAVLAAATAIATGLWQVNAPRWMVLVLAAWTLIVVAAAILCQRRGMALDTYQAIWGPDTAHPGNRIAPIGWGIRRRPPQA